jgi:PAS domain S-box-containing protein
MGILVHQEGKVVLANPAAAEILRARHPGDLLGRGVMSFIPPESRALVQERYAALKGKEARLPPVEYPIVTLDGTPITVEVVTRSLLHQGEHRALTMMRDVTRCRKAEEEVAAIRAGLETRNRRLTEEGQVRETAARELERRFREAAAQERRVLEALGSLLAESGRESEGRILLERMGEAAARREDAVALCLDLLRPLKGETVGQVP